MKSITTCIILTCLCLAAVAQTTNTTNTTAGPATGSAAVAPTVASVALPTYISVGVAFNQIGSPRVNMFATAIYPVVSSIGLFLSTSTDICPVNLVDPVTKRAYIGFSTSVRQGVHKQLYAAGNLMFLLGGDAGAGFSQASPTGVNVSLAGSFQVTAIYKFKPKWAVVVPLGGVYVNGAWNMIPRIGISFKP